MKGTVLPVKVLPIRILLVLGLALPMAAAAAERQKADLVVVAPSVLAVDAAFSVYSPGAVAVVDGVLVAVGREESVLAAWEPRELRRLPGTVLMPGLVNTHTHAAMNLLRGVADDMPLMEWLQKKIFPAEGRNVSPAFVRDGTELAAAEMLRGGTTTFVDMYYFEWDVADVVDRVGMRGVLGETWLDFPVASHKDLAESIRVTRAFLQKYKGHPRVTAAVAPHAPYTNSRESLLAAKALADEFGAPLVIHVSETRDEQKQILEKYGTTPVKWLDSIGFLSPKVLIAHGVWLEPEDLKILAARRVSLAHNPESNMKLASGMAPVVAARAAGVVVGLGTDGVAGSNNDLDMLDAMDFAGKLAKVREMDSTVLPARDLVRMATIDGARAIGMERSIGSLEPGKRADFIAVRLEGSRSEPVYDPASAVVYSAKASSVVLTVVDGKVLWDGKALATIDEADVLRRARAWRGKIEAQLSEPQKPPAPTAGGGASK